MATPRRRDPDVTTHQRQPDIERLRVEVEQIRRALRLVDEQLAAALVAAGAAAVTLSDSSPANVTGAAPLAGTSDEASRADHRHDIEVTAVLDTLDSTRGTILSRGAGAWVGIDPGTATHVLTSNGAGADPTYQAASSGLTQEQVEDVVDALIIDSPTIAWTYVDGTPSLSAATIFAEPTPAQRTIYEVDFSSLANNTITDTTEVIDGLSWTGLNSASAGTFAIQNGTGLRISATTSVAATAFTNASQLVPMVYLPLGSIPGWNPQYEHIIEIYCSTMTLEQSGEAILLGLWALVNVPQTSSAARVRVVGIRSNPTTFSPRATAAATVTIGDEVITTHNCLAIRVNSHGITECLTGVWSAGWPTSYSPGLILLPQTTPNDPFNHAAVRIAIGLAVASDASPTTTVVVQRMRVRRIG